MELNLRKGFFAHKSYFLTAQANPTGLPGGSFGFSLQAFNPDIPPAVWPAAVLPLRTKRRRSRVLSLFSWKPKLPSGKPVGFKTD